MPLAEDGVPLYCTERVGTLRHVNKGRPFIGALLDAVASSEARYAQAPEGDREYIADTDGTRYGVTVSVVSWQ